MVRRYDVEVSEEVPHLVLDVRVVGFSDEAAEREDGALEGDGRSCFCEAIDVRNWCCHFFVSYKR